MRRNTHKTKLDAIEALLKPKPPRPEGLLNEFTGDLKAAYLQAAQAAGGEDGIAGYLYDQVASLIAVSGSCQTRASTTVQPASRSAGSTKALSTELLPEPESPVR